MKRDRVKTALSASLLATDVVLVALGFAVGYCLRANVPLPAKPENPRPLSDYAAMWLVHVIAIIAIFYFYRLYHMARATSRIDQAYAIFGAVSIGTLLTVAITELALKNSVVDLDYPRGMVVYAWLLTIVFVIAGRTAHRQLMAATH